MTGRIVLTTIGSLGDLHPFIAIALALRAHGFDPLLAVPTDHVAKAVAAGIEAVPVLPSFDAIRERMGLTGDEAVARVMGDMDVLFREILLPSLAESARALDAAAAGAVALVGSLFMFAAPIVAAKRGIPLVSAVLQPMTLFSAWDPPRTPEFRMFRGSPRTAAGRGWNRMLYALIRAALRRRYATRIDAVRAEHGLAALRPAVMFDDGDPALTLGCYSPLFAPLPPDAPGTTHLIGFPMFDSDSGAPETLDPELESFLAAGPPPLVFTLGSFAVHAPGGFYAEAAVAAKRLGLRAVLLAGPQAAPSASGAILVRDYVPHSALFPRAAAIVHHGGIGTTGQALRAGRPQLVVPHMSDQHDNARRIERLGVGRSIAAGAFTADRAQPALAHLLADPPTTDRARALGEALGREDGAETAAGLIARLVAGGGR